MTSDYEVAALFVAPDGPYANRPGVDAWTEDRDARNYNGTLPVVAHPPCQRWGRFAEGSPTHKRFKIGDDNGCFKSALLAVWVVGGVLEHPQGSHAWSHFHLPLPPRKGWSHPDEYGGRSCYVDQGAYGHSAKKPTWLYAVLDSYPELNWTRVWGRPYIGGDGFHSARERARAKARADYKPKPQIPNDENYLTPEPFAALLVSLALQKPVAVEAAPSVGKKPPLRARAAPVQGRLPGVLAHSLGPDRAVGASARQAPDLGVVELGGVEHEVFALPVVAPAEAGKGLHLGTPADFNDARESVLVGLPDRLHGSVVAGRADVPSGPVVGLRVVCHSPAYTRGAT